MIWLKAIWYNFKNFLVDTACGAVIAAIIVLMFLVIGAVLYGVLWVINHFFGAAGVLWAAGLVMAAMLIACLVELCKNVWRSVKNTKERLEAEAAYEGR